jgi:glycosyltransferase involved in cell wall biosynthesis
MIKMAVLSPGVWDGQSYYRAAGPLGRLRQQMPNLLLEYFNSVGWPELHNVDIVFMQRPGAEEHLKIIKLAKDCGKPLWVDMDDCLLEVPRHNEAWEVFRDRTQIIEESMILADIVTTATPNLAEKYRKYNKNIVVVPNGLDERLLQGYDPICKKVDINTIYWRGSKGHIKDLVEVADDIVAVAKAHPEIKWQFHGYFPWFIAERLQAEKRHVDHIKTVDVIEFFPFLKKTTKHALGIVPLEASTWNRQKSNISWLENTLAGAQTFVPNLAEFQQPGVKTYTPGKFKEELLALLDSRTDKTRQDSVQQSLEAIHSNWTLSHVNKKRIEIVHRLLENDLQGVSNSKTLQHTPEPIKHPLSTL